MLQFYVRYISPHVQDKPFWDTRSCSQNERRAHAFGFRITDVSELPVIDVVGFF